MSRDLHFAPIAPPHIGSARCPCSPIEQRDLARWYDVDPGGECVVYVHRTEDPAAWSPRPSPQQHQEAVTNGTRETNDRDALQGCVREGCGHTRQGHRYGSCRTTCACIAYLAPEVPRAAADDGPARAGDGG